MKIIEFGKDNKEVILFLHGGGLSWWSYREVAELLQNKYHVVLPILDGHSGSDRDFTSIEDNAQEIIAYIDKEYGGSVLLIGGLSLGGQILVEMLSQRSDICKYAVIESALIIPMKMTNAMVTYIFVGQKEQSIMIRSARLLHEKIPGSMIEVKQGMIHGDFSINHAREFAGKINKIMEGVER